MDSRSLLGPLLTATMVATGSTTALAGDTTAAPSPSTPDASSFTNGRVTNRWFPLKPGTRMVYRGIKDGQRAVDVFFVTHRTRVVRGVTCRAVRDRLWLGGVLRERTVDWYAQSSHGDVWYFGERTAELDRQGHVTSREGSWMAGRDGAKPGIYITAHPRAGQTRRQEYYRGHAEDHFRVLDRSARVRVPLLSSRNAVLTKEWTPLEPGVVDHKYYVRDIGVVSERATQGPTETNNLVAVTHVR